MVTSRGATCITAPHRSRAERINAEYMSIAEGCALGAHTDTTQHDSLGHYLTYPCWHILVRTQAVFKQASPSA